MPNWCNNLLTMKSKNRKLLEEVQSSVSEGIRADREKGLLNHFKPMPDDLRSTVKGCDNSTPKWQKENSRLLQKKYGVDNWYDWAVKNWGTKWDVLSCSHFDLISLDDDVWMLSIQFETAWAPPINAIEYFVEFEKKILSEVTLQYIETGMTYCGVYNFLDTSESFEVDNYLEDDIPGDLVGDYIWLEEEVEAERAYQKEQAL